MKDSATGPAAGANQGAEQQEAGQVYRRLLRYAQPHWRVYLLGVLGMLLYAASQFLILRIIKGYFGDASGIPGGGHWAPWALPLAVVALFLMRGAGDFMGSYFPAWVGRHVVKTIRGQLFAHLLRMPASYYDREPAATMLTRLTNNVELVAQSITDSVTVMIRDSLSIVVFIAYLFYLNWRLALFAVITAPLVAWLVRNINLRFRRYSARIQGSVSEVMRSAKEALEAQRVVKVFNAQHHIEQGFEQAIEHNRSSNMRLLSARASSSPIVQLIASVGLAAVLYIAALQINAGQIKLGDFLVFLATLMLIPQPLKNLAAVAGPLQQGIAAGANVFAILDAPIEPQGGERTLARARGEVEFRNVCFQYQAEKGSVLDAINLKVAAGATVAIVGRSGSGKSTLVSLLPRFYDPDSGQILLDGVDTRDYRLADLRAQMSLVNQEVMLFNDSIRNNILFGAEGVSEPQLLAAAEAAYVMEFAQNLPQGLDTVVGDRGSLLSGGQRQRVAIARALLRDSPILILDEATSALDTASERYIQAALEKLVRNRTTFIIAHRLSTVEHADLIVVMREGRIIESGTHAALLAASGAYAQLHQMQFNE
ncbi:MAG: lipid A export permease/ATP-binding protein MsbA [Steroidobacteraceae bacterium]